jgi:hypothetical protein
MLGGSHFFQEWYGGWRLGVWKSNQWLLANQTIDFNTKLHFLNIQRIYSEPLFLSWFFEEISQSFEFFLKYPEPEITLVWSFYKSAVPGLLEFENFQNPRTAQQWFRGQGEMWSFMAQYWNNICASVTQHIGRQHPWFPLFMPFCGGPYSGKPNASSFTQGIVSQQPIFWTPKLLENPKLRRLQLDKFTTIVHCAVVQMRNH